MLGRLVSGKRLRGIQKTRWKDSCNRDMESVGVKGGGRNGQDKVEERNRKLSRRPQMMGKIREGEE